MMDSEQNNRSTETYKVELHEKSLQDVLSKPPRWIVSYGTGVVFLVVLLLIMSLWRLNYPEVVKSDLMVKSGCSFSGNFNSCIVAEVPVRDCYVDRLKGCQVVDIEFNNVQNKKSVSCQLKLDTIIWSHNNSVEGFRTMLIALPDSLTTTTGHVMRLHEGIRGIIRIKVSTKHFGRMLLNQ